MTDHLAVARNQLARLDVSPDIVVPYADIQAFTQVATACALIDIAESLRTIAASPHIPEEKQP